MIRRDYHIKRYDWVIHVLYNVTCSRISDIIALLRRAGCPESKIREAYGNVGSCKLDVGLTYSNYRSRESVMVIGRTSSYREFSNSLFHECRRLPISWPMQLFQTNYSLVDLVCSLQTAL